MVHEERSDECIAEIVKPKATFVLEASQPLMNPLKYSSWTRLIRVTAWVKRFADNLLAKMKKQGKLSDFETGEGVILTPGELDRAGKLVG